MRHLISLLAWLALAGGAYYCWQSAQEPDWSNLSEFQWRQRLTEEQFQVLREAATEEAFSGIYHDHKEPGEYLCAGCNRPLFVSETKFDSGTGWPSFYQPVGKEAVAHKQDNTFIFPQVEVLCGGCGGHLGHVFPDGPKPTGLRYCINSAALDFRGK